MLTDDSIAPREAAVPLTLPNLLSALRLVLAPVLVALAWTGQPGPFLAVLAVALLSDCCDGWLARRLGQTTLAGTRLDSWGDLATWAIVPVGAWWLWPDLVRREALFVAAAAAAFALPIAAGWLRFAGLGRRLHEFHEPGLTPAAGVNLRLDHGLRRAAVENVLGGLLRIIDGLHHATGRHRNTRGRKNLACLILVNFHGRRS